MTTDIFDFLLSAFYLILVILFVLFILFILGFAFILWYRWRDREKKSLQLITLLVAVPQDNEVKIDAM